MRTIYSLVSSLFQTVVSVPITTEPSLAYSSVLRYIQASVSRLPGSPGKEHSLVPVAVEHG